MLASGEIVHAVAARITGLPLGAAVATDRTWPLSESDLPAWRVVEVDDEIDPGTVHRLAQQKHALQIELRGTVRAVSGVDDAARAIVQEALAALFAVSPPDDALKSVNLRNVQITLRRIQFEYEEAGQAVLGRAVVTLRAEYFVAAATGELASH